MQRNKKLCTVPVCTLETTVCTGVLVVVSLVEGVEMRGVVVYSFA